MMWRAHKFVEDARSRTGERHSDKVIKVDWWQGSSHPAAERQRSKQAIALCVTATWVLMVTVGLLARSYLNAISGITYETATESRTEVLADGTHILLGAGAKLRVIFTAKRRLVQHLAGEVIFIVAQDAARPFVVTTFLADLVQGTRFRVLVNSSVTVTAYEGVVRVLARGAKRQTPAVTVVPGKPCAAGKCTCCGADWVATVHVVTTGFV